MDISRLAAEFHLRRAYELAQELARSRTWGRRLHPGELSEEVAAAADWARAVACADLGIERFEIEWFTSATAVSTSLLSNDRQGVRRVVLLRRPDSPLGSSLRIASLKLLPETRVRASIPVTERPLAKSCSAKLDRY